MRTLPLHRLPLAVACFALFAACADIASAAPLPVSNCADAGNGSLRAAIASAAEGDTITIPSNLGCSKITLRTGALTVTRTNLRIEGPGADKMLISGKYINPGGSNSTEQDRIITHTGGGQLEIDGLALGKGYLVTGGSAVAEGGCVYSAGKLSLTNSTVTFCTAKSNTAYSAGGALFARKGIYVGHSTVSYNLADAVSGNSSGGGIAADYSLTIKYSTISHNTAGNSTTKKGTFGGFLAVYNGAATPNALRNVIGYSTISDNYASSDIAGGGVVGNVVTFAADITVSRNSTPGNVAGLYLSGYGVAVANSTIAFNTANGNGAMATGVQFVGQGAGANAALYSTIVSNNTIGPGQAVDVGASNVTIAGSNNLVYNAAIALPPDTIRLKCPLLAPLADNGGETQSIKLLGHSPAIDHGSNTLALLNDQRGEGFPRASGPPGGGTAVPDIGAYEVNRADEIFDATFDAGCLGILARASP